MSGSSASHWTLFIDESGNFDRDDECVLVGGFCFSKRIDPEFSRRFRSYAQKKAPLAPWPIHRWTLKRPAAYVVWARVNSPDDLDPELAGHLSDAAEVLEKCASETFSDAVSRVAKGREPTYESLKILDGIIERELYSSFDYLKSHADDKAFDVARVFKEMAAAESSVGEAFVVLAAESSTGAASHEDDRYLELLKLLLERARREFERRGGEHAIDVNVATRNVMHPVLGAQTPLNQTVLKRVCEHATSEKMRFLPTQVWAYDQEANAGLVMADSVANYFFVDLINAGGFRSLFALENAADSYFGLSLYAGEPGLPQISAWGDAEMVIYRTSETQTAPGELTQMHPWAADQAKAWIAHILNDGADQ